MKNINDIVLNPIRMRIIQALALRETMTATELCESISDIPRTTLYRHIKLLLDNHILSVVSEQKIRGSLERTLSLNTGEITKHNTLENATQTAFSFLMKKYAVFQRYFNSQSADPGKDRVFMHNTILMTTDEEFDQFLKELGELFMKYTLEFKEGRRARDISIISTPEEANKHEKEKR